MQNLVKTVIYTFSSKPKIVKLCRGDVQAIHPKEKINLSEIVPTSKPTATTFSDEVLIDNLTGENADELSKVQFNVQNNSKEINGAKVSAWNILDTSVQKKYEQPVCTNFVLSMPGEEKYSRPDIEAEFGSAPALLAFLSAGINAYDAYRLRQEEIEKQEKLAEQRRAESQKAYEQMMSRYAK